MAQNPPLGSRLHSTIWMGFPWSMLVVASEVLGTDSMQRKDHGEGRAGHAQGHGESADLDTYSSSPGAHLGSECLEMHP